MNARERLLAAIECRPVDRVPYTAWHHFYLEPPAGPGSLMAQAELAFYNQFQPDLLKVMHDIEYEPQGPIDTPEDWTRLTVVDPRTGHFGAQLFTLRLIRERLDKSVPMVDTVFNVFHYANKISKGRLLSHLRTNPEPVVLGLDAVATSIELYAAACLKNGCEGIYYALDGASAEGATRREYHDYFLAYDRGVLATVAAAPFNILHLHGYKDVNVDLADELPAAAVCWSDRTAGPSLAEMRARHRGCVMGGLDETRLHEMSDDDVVAQSRQAIAQVDGIGLILAPGCSVSPNTPPERLTAVRRAVRAG